MIPKKIHYCWFGGKEQPEDVKRYIASWKKYCPDYEIKEWNESNFDIHENDYCREAYEAKKWAFVTDYVRLKALYEEGGFYMDTDVEVVKSLDPLRVYDAVSGYESQTHIQTGTMGACRDNEWIGMLLHYYDHRHFIKKDGKLDLTTNVDVITSMTVKKYHIQLDGQFTPFGNNMVLLPFDYLCAKDLDTGEIRKTANTYTIHHFAASWLPEDVRNYSKLYKKYDAEYRGNGMNPKLSHYVSRIRAAYEIGGISMIFRRLFID
ncbi:MAG: glycosyltransferase [Dialister hominis]|uniref:glycosyltransferase family 32 protein n=1 Tax=Dialister hominis TaxID=2582419 RepID=UPI002EA4E30A|nr:glycosyltransferase [Dialister hominis]